MRLLSFTLVALFIGSLLALPISEPAPAADAAGASSAPAALEGAPSDVASFIRFEPNLGQAPEGILWLGRGGGTDVAILSDRVRLIGEDVVDLVLPTTVLVAGEAPLDAVSHYYTTATITDVPLYGQVRLHMPGVDLVVYGGDEGLQFDHVVAPGTDAAAAGFRVAGGTPHIEADGRLALTGEHGVFHLAAPVTYQVGPSGRTDIASSFVVRGDRVGYDVAAYDPALPLVIDPVVKYSSFLGTTGDDFVRALKVVDPPTPAPADARVLYVGGHAQSSASFPAGLAGTSRAGPGGLRDVFVARFTYDLATRTVTPDWFVYYGGTSNDELHDLDATPDGTVAITGSTTSTNLPIVNPIMLTQPASSPQTPYNGATAKGTWDAYVATFNASGSMTFSSYLNGEDYDHGRAVSLDGNGGVLVGGYCYCGWGDVSAAFPTTQGAYQPISRSWVYDEAFLSYIDTTTTPASFHFSTMLGGGVYDQIYDVAMDSTGVYATGSTQYNPTACAVVATYCPPFPTTPGAFQITHEPSTSTTTRYTAFLTKFLPDGSDLVFSTMLGGTGNQWGQSISLSGTEAWVIGPTTSADFPICPTDCVTGAPAPLQSALSGGGDAFITRFATDGSALEYSSYFGTTGSDVEVRHRPYGNELLLAMRGGGGASTPDGILTAAPGGNDVYVARVDPAAGVVRFGTWFGGTQSDTFHRAVDIDDQGNIYLGGETASTGAGHNFPLAANVQTAAGGADEGFVSIIGKKPPTAVIEATAAGYATVTTPVATPYQVLTGETITLDGSDSLDGDDPLDTTLTLWELKDGGTVVATDSGWPSPTFTGYDPLAMADDGTFEVCLTVEDDSGGPYDHQDTVCMDLEWLNQGPTAAFSATATTSVGSPVSFTDLSTDPDGTITTWAWGFGDGSTSAQQNPSYSFPLAGTYTVTLTVTDDGGLSDSTTQAIQVLAPPIAAFTMPGTAMAGQSVTITDASTAGSRALQSWTWDLGDSSTHVGSAPFTHVFAGGTYTVRLTVSDGVLQNTATRTIVVSEPAVSAVPDSYSTQQDTTLTVPAPGVLGNDGTGLTAMLVSGPSSGALVLNGDGSFSYTPDNGFFGVDSFTYKAKKGTSMSSAVTVTLTVTEFGAPTAAFTYAIVDGTVTFADLSVPGSTALVTWAWTFGGTATSSLQNPVHTFAPGTHTVALTVTDEADKSHTAQATITITGDQDDTGSDDGSDDTGGQTGGSGPSGPAANPFPDDPYPTSGGVHLTADAPPAGTNRPPIAIAQGPATVAVGSLVTLDALASYDPDGDELTVRWAVEGLITVSPATSRTPSFVAAEPGTVRLVLSVSDGSLTDEDTLTIEVIEAVPQPAIAAHATGLAVRVVDTSNAGSDVRRVWDMGDGTELEGAEVTHTYAQAGNYQITLRHEHAAGQSTTQTSVFVAQGAPADPAPSVPADTQDAPVAPSAAARTPGLLEWLPLAGAAVMAVLVVGLLFALRRHG